MLEKKKKKKNPLPPFCKPSRQELLPRDAYILYLRQSQNTHATWQLTTAVFIPEFSKRYKNKAKASASRFP